MNLDEIRLKNGDMITIKGVRFEVLYVQGDANHAPHKDPPVRYFLAIYLHDHKTKTLEPTHVIEYYYDDTKEIFLKEIRGKAVTQKDISLEEKAKQ